MIVLSSSDISAPEHKPKVYRPTLGGSAGKLLPSKLQQAAVVSF